MRERERGRGEIIHRKDFIIINFFFFFQSENNYSEWSESESESE